MTLKFENNERGYTADMNNLAFMNTNAVREGCFVEETTPQQMKVKINVGSVFFGGIFVGVSEQEVVISTAHPSYDRIDLVVVNGSGDVEILEGIAEPTPHTPIYTPSNYVVIARVYVEDGATFITNNNITDLRVINEGVGTFGKYIEDGIISQTSVPVIHNLGDTSPIVFCYDDTDKVVIPESITVDDQNQVTITFNPPFSGKVVIQGGSGAAIGHTHIHTQTAPSDTWIIAHQLGQLKVFVIVYDSTDSWILPDDIQLDSINQLTITFAEPISGSAVIST